MKQLSLCWSVTPIIKYQWLAPNHLAYALGHISISFCQLLTFFKGLGRKRLTRAITVAQDDTRPFKKAKTTTRGANETVASKAQQTQNCDPSHSNAETHAAKPRGARITPSAIYNASAAATMVARIILENIRRGSERDLLETRVEDFNAIDHAENPARNELCEEEPAISREISLRELPESKETRAAKEASKTGEAIELVMLDEHAMIYSLAKDPDSQIQQCYAYCQQKLKEFPIPSHIFRPPCMPCADLFTRMEDDTETSHLLEKQGSTFLRDLAANFKAGKSCAGKRAPCMNEMPMLLRGISKLMSEANFYFHDANHMIPFPRLLRLCSICFFMIPEQTPLYFFVCWLRRAGKALGFTREKLERAISLLRRFQSLTIFQKMADCASAGMEVLSIVQSHVRQVLCSLQYQLDSLPVFLSTSALLSIIVSPAMYYCTFEPGNPTSQHKTACPWCLLRYPRYPVPAWQTNPIPPPTEEQLDRLLHRTSDGLRCYRRIFLPVLSIFPVWLLWTICTICLDWYNASKAIIPFVDLMDEIAENAGLALSVLQLPLYTFVPLQISGGLDPLNGVQSSQFAIIEARAPIHEVISNCLEKASLDDRPEDEETRNITRTWVDAYYIRYLEQMRRPEETEPQAALRLTKTYIALIEDAFMTLSDRHPSKFRMADFSKDSLYILEEVTTRMDQLRETIHRFTSSYSAFMEEMSQAIMPLEACREYYKTIEYHKQEASFANQRACDAKYIADLYKLSLSKAVIAESAVNHLSRELKRKYVLRLGGDLSEVAVGLSRLTAD
ncbi:uncharacterized protein FMAN_15318 [Fusarium mangiferae]|uniref:Uncharacterized protein n=1 Tax=Fusarium mangiferae TaxID=192010 RepID=A0A1L7UI46_FUSMA|nr:uncharacterized protein FMAN_15318 [Fusarium mangiferae]CVL07191.1 uncharacterized protein FMAN_15318 [Fusarium mangiferae]